MADRSHPRPPPRALHATLLALLLPLPFLAGCVEVTGEHAPALDVHPFLKDPRVRQALSHALDAATAAETVYGGYLAPLAGVVPAGIAHAPGAGPIPFPHDPERAERLLDAAGYPRGSDGYRFDGARLRLLVNADNAERRHLAESYAASLDRIGVRADVVAENWPDFLHRLFQTRAWDVAFLAWTPDYLDPDDSWFPLAASRGAKAPEGLVGDALNSGIASDTLDRLIAEARATTDPAARAKLYREAERLFQADPHLLLVGQARAPVVLRDSVQGYSANPALVAPGLFANLGTPLPGGVLTWMADTDPLTLDPARAADPASLRVVQNAYEGLVGWRGGDATAPAPLLAESWTASPDGLEWTFTLRAGVRFANGNPLTADDVAYTLQRLLRLQGTDGNPAWHVSQFLREDGIRAEGHRTVRLTLAAPGAGLLAALASPAAGILDRETCETHGGLPERDAEGRLRSDGCGAWLAEHTMGTGAYQVQDREPGKRVHLARNEHAWAPAHRNAPGWVTLVAEPDEALRIAALMQGDVDGADVSPARTRDLHGAPGLRLWTHPTYETVLGIFQLRPQAG